MKIILALILVFTISACGDKSSGSSKSASPSTENRTVVIPEIEMEFVSRIPNFNATINTTSIPQPDFDGSQIFRDGFSYSVYFNITERSIIRFETDNEIRCDSNVTADERLITHTNILVNLSVDNSLCTPDEFNVFAVSVPHAEISIPYNSTGNEQNNKTYWYAFELESNAAIITVTTKSTTGVQIRNLSNGDEVKPSTTPHTGGVSPSLGFSPTIRTFEIPSEGWYFLQLLPDRQNFYLAIE